MSQPKGVSITISPKIDVKDPTTAPLPDVKKPEKCGIEYGIPDIEDAGLYINQRGYHTKKEYPGDHNPIVPEEVKSMRIAKPVKGVVITPEVINNTAVRYYAGYQMQADGRDFSQRDLTMSRENPENAKVINRPAVGATQNNGYAGQIKNDQYLSNYSLNGYSPN